MGKYRILDYILWGLKVLWFDKKFERYNSMNLENNFSHFYFLNMNFLFTINSLYTKLFLVIEKTFIRREACLRILI